MSAFRQKINGNKEIKNAGWLIIGKVIQMIINFLVSIFTARYLGPGNYGLINYAGAYVAFFTSLCTLGINSIIIKDFVDNPEEQGKAIGTTIGLRAISSFLSAITIVAIIAIVDKGETTTLIVAALCSTQLIFHVFDTINYWFQSRYESKVTAISTLIAFTVTALYKVVLLLLHKDVIWFAFATSLDYICLGILLMISYTRASGPKLSFSWIKGKALLGSSYHYILSGMMVAIYGHTDRLMLKQMLDETAVGYYSLAASVNTMWVFVLQAIIDSVYPTIMQLYKSNNTKGFERKNRQLYAIVIYTSIFVAVMFILFGEWAIGLIYGDAYLPAATPLKVITWYTIFSYLGVARNAWIVCNNNQKYLKYMYLTAAVVNIIINYFMIPIWGASGAAAASLITQVMTSIILPCFIKDMRPNVQLMIDAFLLRGIK